jgi:hypothetical protein
LRRFVSAARVAFSLYCVRDPSRRGEAERGIVCVKARKRKTSGADIEALAAETSLAAKAKPKLKGAARAPAKRKRVPRKRKA